jgi:hypothetical protein
MGDFPLESQTIPAGNNIFYATSLHATSLFREDAKNG